MAKKYSLYNPRSGFSDLSDGQRYVAVPGPAGTDAPTITSGEKIDTGDNTFVFKLNLSDGTSTTVNMGDIVPQAVTDLVPELIQEELPITWIKVGNKTIIDSNLEISGNIDCGTF
jgi:hypothetical protein